MIGAEYVSRAIDEEQVFACVFGVIIHGAYDATYDRPGKLLIGRLFKNEHSVAIGAIYLAVFHVEENLRVAKRAAVASAGDFSLGCMDGVFSGVSLLVLVWHWSDSVQLSISNVEIMSGG